MLRVVIQTHRPPMSEIITLNVQGLRSLPHWQTLMSWLNCFSPDIVCLQETHSTSEREFSEWFSTTNKNVDNKIAISASPRLEQRALLELPS